MGESSGDTDRDLEALRTTLQRLESFDEVIAESVRRTRALLEEATELRDRARRELEDARAGIERDRTELTAIAQRILGHQPARAILNPPTGSAPPAETQSPVAPAATEPATNNTIIVNGVSRPAIATALRAHLMAQPGVTAVDPREFAEGVLRLQVVASVPIEEATFAGWKDGEGLTVVQVSPNVLEIVLPGA